MVLDLLREAGKYTIVCSRKMMTKHRIGGMHNPLSRDQKRERIVCLSTEFDQIKVQKN